MVDDRASVLSLELLEERKGMCELTRCERCAVSIYVGCAIEYSHHTGSPNHPCCLYAKCDVLRGALLCSKCFDEFLPYCEDDDPGDTKNGGFYDTRPGGVSW